MIGQNLNANAQNSKPSSLLHWTGARVTSFLGRVTRGALLSVGALTVAGVTGAGLLSQQAAKQGLQLPKDFVLVMDFDGTKLVEKADPRAKLWAEGNQIQLSKVVDALYRAGADKRVQGIMACFGDAQQYVALAQVQELRNAVRDFRQAKADSVPTVAYSDSFGEAGGSGTIPYYLASAFDQIYIHDTGMLSFTGFAASQPFLRGLLDKWHIKPLAFAREEYKSAASLLTDKAYSKANREATKAWLNSWMGQIVQDVAAARGLRPQDVCKALNASPLSVDKAAAAGLITGPGLRSAVTQTLLHSATSAADPATLVGRQVAELSNAQPAELSKLKAADSAELKAGQRAVSAANPSESSRTSAPDSPAQLSGKPTHMLGRAQPVLHSAAEQDSAQVPAVSPAQSSEVSACSKSLELADAQEQATGASAASEHHRVESSVRNGTAQRGNMTKVQRLQAVKKPVNTAMVVQVTPDWLEMKCCRAVPIGKYIQEHERKQGQKQGSLLQTVWAAVTGAGNKKESNPTADLADAKSAKAGTPKPQVAVITASGQILAGSATSSLNKQTEIRSTELGKELQKARHDPKVKAVVLRVDSPGGSAVASDAIYQDLLKVQQAGKPVVVSMGNLAASGGYYISAGANKIVAQPGTITGSIGVVFGKLDVSQALRDQGISVDTIAVGKNATASSPFHDFTKEQQRHVNAMIDRTYVQFLSRVALGRNMSIWEVRKVARGRIWTGEDALHHGLVDKLGGLKDAVHLAKQEAGLPQEDDAVEVVDFPPAKSVFQLLKEALGEQPIGFDAAALLAQNDSTALPLWWFALTRQLGIDNVNSLPLAAGVFPSSCGAQLVQQGSLATSVSAQQQSGLQMLCDPVIVR